MSTSRSTWQSTLEKEEELLTLRSFPQAGLRHNHSGSRPANFCACRVNEEQLHSHSSIGEKFLRYSPLNIRPLCPAPFGCFACGLSREAVALIVQPEVALSQFFVIGHLFGQSRTVIEGRLTESAREGASYAVVDIFFRSHTLARHRPNKGPAVNITTTLHKTIRITPPPNSLRTLSAPGRKTNSEQTKNSAGQVSSLTEAILNG